MRGACIDIGSNTTRLLVAERIGGRLVGIHQERAFTRVGLTVGACGRIGEAKIAEVVEVVCAQLRAAHVHRAQTVRAVATAAVRDAGDGPALAAAIERATGVSVEILSGEREARLAFRGAVGAVGDVADVGADTPTGPVGVIDAGGGSLELVVGVAPDAVRWWASVGLGSGALTDRCLRCDPPSVDQLSEARSLIAGELAGLAPPRPTQALAVGGSATSVARLVGPALDAAALQRSLRLLTAQPSATVASRFGIDPVRARLLPAGLLIVQAAAGLLGAECSVGAGGIREGVLLEALDADRR
ncbi:MAG: hypothetical protein ACRDMX_05650 [Solirubrobacteraceae bacterium]